MGTRNRTMYAKVFKVKIGKALKEGTPVRDLVGKYSIDRSLLLKWGKQYANHGARAFKANGVPRSHMADLITPQKLKPVPDPKPVTTVEDVHVERTVIDPPTKLNGVSVGINEEFVDGLRTKWNTIAEDIRSHEEAIERLKRQGDPLSKLIEAAHEYVSSF